MKLMRLYRIFLPAVAVALVLSCSAKAETDADGGGTSNVPQGNVELKPTVDRTSVLKNPMTGWVMYVSGSSDPSYFDTEFYVPSLGKNVLVRDYASCFYVRTGWKTFNPEEGKYFWQDPDNALYKLYKRAQELGLPMAFRVVVDGRDQRENTPQWVFDKGAQFWLSDKNYPDRKTPLAIDETWRKCYEKFIEDFAAEFNDPDKLAFIDAYGLGKWGEGHNVCYEQNNAETAMTETYKEDTMRWITGLYSRCFTKVPLVINYHRQIGCPVSEGKEANPNSEKVLQIALDNGYCLRADSFGMTNQDWGYNDWERGYVEQWKYKVPIIMEGGYIVSSHSYWNDPKGYRQGHPEDVRKGEFEESQGACVNMMDFRVGDETKSWFEDAFTYVQRFIEEGGYRLYPEKVSVPQNVGAGEDAVVTSTWRNLGWGYCPTNLKQWDQKYKVAFALLDMQTGEPVYEYIDEKTDLSKWLNGSPAKYEFEIPFKGVAVGAYTWAVGIVDKTKADGNGIHEIGIRLAVSKDSQTDDGWVRLTNVTVQK